MHQDLESQVALLLDTDDDSDIDGEALWQQLCDAVEAAPDDVALRLLREAALAFVRQAAAERGPT